VNLTTVPFAKAAEDATGGNPKIQRRDYLKAGRLPVIDQGQEEIAGYTDDDATAYRGDLPVVLFGDHTRAFKYVNHPFALGADGVKVLRPHNGFVAKFLYYYFLSCDIPSHGYSRHFKFVKELDVPVVSPSEQRRIVEILDQADALRKLRREADAKTARILPVLFLKMFGDPAANPMGWPDEPLAKLCNPKQWPTISTRELKESGFPVYGANGRIGFFDKFNHEHATVLITCRGATCGTVGVCTPKSYVTGNAMALDDPDPDKTSIEFLKWFLRLRGLSDTISGSAQPQITRAGLAPVRVFTPNETLVGVFSKRVREVESMYEACKRAGAEVEKLFSLMLARAFSGQLTNTWRQDHMQELLAEMQEQARLLNLPLPN
jgi:type I restriction enzyme S subunit